MSKLKETRANRHMTQAELADSSGVSVRMIQKYEQGDRDINKAQGSTLFSLAKALECQIEDILE